MRLQNASRWGKRAVLRWMSKATGSGTRAAGRSQVPLRRNDLIYREDTSQVATHLCSGLSSKLSNFAIAMPLRSKVSIRRQAPSTSLCEGPSRLDPAAIKADVMGALQDHRL